MFQHEEQQNDENKGHDVTVNVKKEKKLKGKKEKKTQEKKLFYFKHE